MTGEASLKAIASAMGGEVRGGVAAFPTPGHSAKDRGTWAYANPDAPDGIWIESGNGGDPLEIKDQLRAKGVLPQRETKARPQFSGGGGTWRCTGTYEYDDGDGQVIYRTRRLEQDGKPKRFVAERLEGGKWLNGLGDVVRLPYRFTELCQAAERARNAGEPEPPIYFAEGERKADKLAGMGFLATAIAFGAGGWRESYGEAFTGATVIILPDNDEPGQKFAAKVKAGIEEHGGKAHILDLPGLPPKGDIIDWTGSANDLRELTAKALLGLKPMLPLLDLAVLQGPPPPARRWALQDFIPAGELTLFTGPGGAGKSLFGQQLATCIAAGLPFLGVAAMRSAALYITAEDDEDELHRRQRNISSAMGGGDLTGQLHLSSLRGRLGNELCTFDTEGRLHVSPTFQLVTDTIIQTGSKFAVLDNVAHLFTGNENDRGEVTQFANLLNKLALDTGATIVLVGHPNKAGDSYSGSTAWLNAVRSQIELNWIGRDGDIPDQDARQLTLGKANYARKGTVLEFRWHDFAFVLGSDLSPDYHKELSQTIADTADNGIFLECLRERLRQRRAVSEKRSPSFAPTEFAKMAESKGIGRARLEKAMDRLFRINAIERGELWKGDDRKAVFGLRETVSSCG